MAKRRGAARHGSAIDLFPFLSVLVCTIASLILVIIVTTSNLLGSASSITLAARDSDGNNVTLRPSYIEVRADGVLIHPSQEFVPTRLLGRRDTPLARLLIRVSRVKDREYIIVAVRPDGFELFDRVREQVENRGIQIGYEPIEQDWTLRIRQ